LFHLNIKTIITEPRVLDGEFPMGFNSE